MKKRVGPAPLSVVIFLAFLSTVLLFGFQQTAPGGTVDYRLLTNAMMYVNPDIFIYYDRNVGIFDKTYSKVMDGSDMFMFRSSMKKWVSLIPETSVEALIKAFNAANSTAVPLENNFALPVPSVLIGMPSIKVDTPQGTPSSFTENNILTAAAAIYKDKKELNAWCFFMLAVPGIVKLDSKTEKADVALVYVMNYIDESNASGQWVVLKRTLKYWMPVCSIEKWGS